MELPRASSSRERAVGGFQGFSGEFIFRTLLQVTGDIFVLVVLYFVSVAQRHCLLKATGAVRDSNDATILNQTRR